jgi:hypothetical protein
MRSCVSVLSASPDAQISIALNVQCVYHQVVATYADRLRQALKTSQNRLGHPITIRMLEQATGYTYEHIRKAVKGEPVVSKRFNEIVCEYLGLNEAEMWRLAVLEKAARRLGESVDIPALAPDERFKSAWSKLGPTDRKRLLDFAEALAAAADVRKRAGQARKSGVRGPVKLRS